MPYTIDGAGSVVRMALFGAVTVKELMALAGELDVIARVRPAWPDHLADFRAVETRAVSYPAMVSLVKRRLGVTFPNPVRSAIVVTAPVGIGFARMFQNLNESPQLTVGVFSSLDAAEAWLATPPAAAPVGLSADRLLPRR